MLSLSFLHLSPAEEEMESVMTQNSSPAISAVCSACIIAAMASRDNPGLLPLLPRLANN